MRHSLTFLCAMALGWMSASSARAEHAKIQLEVATPRDQVTAFVDQTPPDWGKNPRPVLKAKTNEGVDAVGRGEAIAAHVVATLSAR